MFTIGKSFGSAMLNSALIPKDDQKNEVKYRIIGRQALKGEKNSKKPKMSYSVPFGWFFTMPKRIQKDRSRPMPIEIKEGEEVKVLEDFKEG